MQPIKPEEIGHKTPHYFSTHAAMLVNKINPIINKINEFSSSISSLGERFTKFCDDINSKVTNLSQDLQKVKDTAEANHQALSAAVAQDRDNTKEAILTHDKELQARDRTIRAQAEEIRNIQQREVSVNSRTADLEAQSQEEKARRVVVDNRIRHLELDVTHAQTAVIEAKIKIARIELQNNIQFKLQEKEKKEQDDLKQQVFNVAKNLQKFQLVFENNKKEAKSKWDQDALKIAQLRAKIGDGVAPKAVAVAVVVEDVQEYDQIDSMIREIEKEMAKDKNVQPEEDEANLKNLMAHGGPQGDLQILERQTQLLVNLQEVYKVKRERLSHCLIALNMKMDQLSHSYGAFREMTKQKEQETAYQIAQLTVEVAEKLANKSQESIKTMKRQRSLVGLNPNHNKAQ